MLPSDSLLHQSHKILADITSVPPPPYSKPHNPPTDDEDDEGNDDEIVSSQPPTTITVDTSTRIVGHANDIHLPHSPSPPGQIAGMLLAALKSAQQDGGKRGVEIKLQTGFSICGSRNVVVLGPMGAQGLAKEKRMQGEAQSSVDGGQNTASRKRRAESEPAEMPNAKKAVARDLEPRG